MVSLIESTNGVWLIAMFLESILQGMGLLQGFLYFVWYHSDPWSVKGTVIVMLVLETGQMGAAFANVYGWFVLGFGNFENLNIIHAADVIQLAALYLSTFVAQVHFAKCIYQLHTKSYLLPVMVLLCAVIALGGGLGQVILVVGIREYSSLGKTSATSNLQAAFALAADMLITFGLCWRLNQNRSGIQSTNNMLNFLIMTAINRGVFTMFFAAINIVLFLSQPGTFYFMVALLLSNKFYMNSMLAMLNTRQYAFQLHGSTIVERMSIPVFAANSGSTDKSSSGSTLHQSEIALENLNGKLEA
ncbi:hypothetical protein MVEN_02264000 [Mycena venus]|uniref:DUF6534 domain-containing protein n=1 Tax=Mycena venus TaxID=2733690 RepID=A0A8H6U121_9AGAR|nr:hypothetical protein MVEN_02613800 [Mycena venus]KAF7335131.1 hypothetical protein MVEN_02264000 [Mycena venus]